MSYIDLHTHTLLSDGEFPAETLIRMAEKEGIGHLALTDHNRIHTDIGELQRSFPNIELISASEISAVYDTADGQTKEIHIVGLFLEQTEELCRFLADNCENGYDRMTKMLEKLTACGIELDCHSGEAFRDMYYPNRKFVGRRHLAEVLVKRGYVPSIDAAMEKYIGEHGERLAYVPNAFHFADMKHVVDMIHRASGTAVLAHPFSYKLSQEELIRLLSYFKSLGGDAMEVQYGKYTKDMCCKLEELAEQYSFLPSCGSDFHGNRIDDRLDHKFSSTYLEALRSAKYKK